MSTTENQTIKKPETPNISINLTQNQSQAQSQFQGGYSDNNSKYSKTTALVLCCLGFLGIGGIHRLYTGHVLSGIIYLFTFGLFFIGTAYDIFLILTNNFRDKQGKLLIN